LPGPEDPLSRELKQLAAPADPAGAYERIVERKIRRQIYRRLEVAALVIVVVAGTVGGSFVLFSAFRPGNRPVSVAAPLADNGLIAFVSNRDGNPDVYVMNHDGSQATNLTHDPADDHAPAFSPDGSKIAFVSDRDGNPDIYVMNADGTDVRRVVSLPGYDDSPSWSPDSSMIAFADNTDLDGHQVNYQLYVANADGSEVTRLTTDLALDHSSRPAWSPDGTRIAFTNGRFVHPTNCPARGGCPVGVVPEILVAASDGSQVQRLSTVEDASAPEWSPDGSRIAFRSSGHIFVMRDDGRDIHRVTEGPSIDGAPSWSPDGTKLVFASELDGDQGIDVVDATGSDRTRLTSDVAGESAPSWQPLPKSHTPQPNHSPTPSSLSPTPHSPSPSPSCAMSTVGGDFDGDGLVDTATVGEAPCLPPARPTAEGTALYSLRVTYGDGIPYPNGTATYPITDCESVCRALAATDLNGDGMDELFVVVDEGASTGFLSVFELQNGETAGGQATTVGLPDAPGFPADEPAVFEFGGSVTHQGFVTCRTTAGVEQVISTIAQVDRTQTTWEAHETVFTFGIYQNEGVPFPKFNVVSTDDYTQPFDPTGRIPFQPHGKACFEVEP
jgi:Tol biopolymer transport system component